MLHASPTSVAALRLNAPLAPGAAGRCQALWLCYTLTLIYTCFRASRSSTYSYYRMAITGMPKWSLVGPVRCHSVLFMGFTSAAVKFGSVSTDSHWGCWRILGAAWVALRYRAITRIQPGLAIATQLLYIAIYTIKSPTYFVTCFHYPSNKQPSKYKTFTMIYCSLINQKQIKS